MLLRFRGANHRSFRDEFELWMAGSKFNLGSARSARLPEDSEATYLPAVVIYGANGSGKSNVLLALRWMRNAVLNSVHQWSALDHVPREPFALDPSAREETSLFEVDIVLGDDRFVYGFEVSDRRVESEWLHAYPRGQARRQVWFERDADAKDPFRFPGEGLRGPKESLVSQTRPNALFLTVAAAFNQPYLGPIHDWFKRNLWWVSPGHDLEQRHQYTAEALADPRQKHRIVALLKAADMGIVDALAEQESGRVRVRLVHGGPRGDQVLDFDTQESMGTYSWFAFLGPMLEALDRGSVLLVDELDASLHPLLTAEVLRIFQNPEANPRHAQIVCTAHDASLVGTAHAVQPLERDQIRITVKGRDGRSELYPLTDARPRKNEPLERGMLLGKYGGIPEIMTEDLADEVVRRDIEVNA